MKTFIFIFSVLSLVSCKPTIYMGNYGQQNQTQVVLSNANFKTLGSFTGVYTQKKKVLSVKNRVGLIASAKADLLLNAKENGIELIGSRTLINVSVDIIENPRRVTATISGEIIEFNNVNQKNEPKVETKVEPKFEQKVEPVNPTIKTETPSPKKKK